MIARRFVLLFAGFSLAACANFERPTRDYDIWSSETHVDQCGIADTITRYWVDDEPNNGRRRLSSIWRSDRDSLLRAKHRDADWHILGYIANADQFNAQPGCRTAMTIEPSTEGSRAGSSVSYDIRYSPTNYLCQHSPFRMRFGDWVSGTVISCVNTVTSRKTFDVLYDE